MSILPPKLDAGSDAPRSIRQHVREVASRLGDTVRVVNSLAVTAGAVVVNFDTRAEAATAAASGSIPITAQVITTAGYATVGDGGHGRYVLATAPALPALASDITASPWSGSNASATFGSGRTTILSSAANGQWTRALTNLAGTYTVTWVAKRGSPGTGTMSLVVNSTTYPMNGTVTGMPNISSTEQSYSWTGTLTSSSTVGFRVGQSGQNLVVGDVLVSLVAVADPAWITGGALAFRLDEETPCPEQFGGTSALTGTPSDSAAAFTAAFSYLTAYRGVGVVEARGNRYRLSSSVIIPVGCTLRHHVVPGEPIVASGNQRDTSTQPGFLLDAGAEIIYRDRAKSENVACYATGLVPVTDERTALDVIKLMDNDTTAHRLGVGGGSNSARQARIINGAAFGFTYGVQGQTAPGAAIEGFIADCKTPIKLSSCGDVVQIDGLRSRAYLTTDTPGSSRPRITSWADNGAGLVRFTSNFDLPALTTGRYVYIDDVRGDDRGEVEGFWEVTRIAASTWDLVGSTWSSGYDLEGGSFQELYLITSVSSGAGGVIRVELDGDLDFVETGDHVHFLTMTGTGASLVNGDHIVTVIDAHTFDLDGTVYDGALTYTGGRAYMAYAQRDGAAIDITSVDGCIIQRPAIKAQRVGLAVDSTNVSVDTIEYEQAASNFIGSGVHIPGSIGVWLKGKAARFRSWGGAIKAPELPILIDHNGQRAAQFSNLTISSGVDYTVKLNGGEAFFVGCTFNELDPARGIFYSAPAGKALILQTCDIAYFRRATDSGREALDGPKIEMFDCRLGATNASETVTLSRAQTRLIGTTSGAATARLTEDAGAATALNCPTLHNSLRVRMYRVMVRAEWTAGAAGADADFATWDETVVLSRPSNTASTTIAGGGASLVPAQSAGSGSAWRLDILADTTLGGLDVSGTGAANNDVTWTARIWAL